MKVSYKLRNSTLDVEGKDCKDLFAQLSAAVEVFSQDQCGACESNHVVPSVRENQGNTFYEMRCLNCHATLAFGQRRQDGALYPRRKNPKTGEWLDNGGWVKWNSGPSHDFE